MFAHTRHPDLFEAVAGERRQHFCLQLRLPRRQRPKPDPQDAGRLAADIFRHPDLEKINGARTDKIAAGRASRARLLPRRMRAFGSGPGRYMRRYVQRHIARYIRRYGVN